ncbi:hypothetical protein CEXT_132061 [Caerostris extrusa]|uniref:Uncharacterized protein n=1 Tax=Caerostris extrusa TaxID=172846 RepID=A0AAV4Y265_CAEEX|nr:hypothetical protein CEXT_132061 [Caerostris extrusa]
MQMKTGRDPGGTSSGSLAADICSRNTDGWTLQRRIAVMGKSGKNPAALEGRKSLCARQSVDPRPPRAFSSFFRSVMMPEIMGELCKKKRARVLFLASRTVFHVLGR